MKAIAAAAVLLLLPLAGCGSNKVGDGPQPQEEEAVGAQTVSGPGTISWRSVEGGFFVIEADDGTTYDPINLPAEYRRDGLRVHFEATLRTDLMSTHMAGTLIEITEIRELDDPT